MLSDLDSLMGERAIDTLIVPMHERLHPAFRWITRGAKITRGYAVKLIGQEPLLIHYPMERDEAAASGLPTKSIHDFDYNRFFHAGADPAAAYCGFFDHLLREIGSGQSLGVSGEVPVHLYFDFLGKLEAAGWRIHRSGDDLVQLARKKKDANEIEAIRSVGHRTEQVVSVIRAILKRVKIVDGIAHADGRALTLGYLKRIVTSEIYRLGMVEDHETILSQGRDAGIPHSRGDRDAFVKASLPIVIDIFPVDQETGYFFDLTRTFCVGTVSPRLATLHQHVLEAFEKAADKMTAGTEAADYQNLVCDYFEGLGYPTTRSKPTTLEGYVHSLGHGVGLEIHERPSFSLSAAKREKVEVGDVLTIEPGLYFPDEELGVRIEDTFYIDESGKPVSFCESSRGLEP